MWRIIFLLSILPLVHSSCPSGFQLVQNECRGNYSRIDTTGGSTNAVDRATTECHGILGLPIIIHNDEQQKYWMSHISSSTPYTVIGIKCNRSSNKWEWADGSALDYKSPNHDPTLDNQDCTTYNNGQLSWMMRSDGAWTFWSGTSTTWTTDIWCTVPLRQPVAAVDSCANFEDDEEDGICYQVGATAENWQDAQMICANLGGNLASIHNSQENSFVRRLAVSKGAVNGVFLGATLTGKGKDFGWIDGSDWDFDYFYPGFPNPILGDCLAMDTTKKEGQWMNVQCSEKLPVACVRNRGAHVDPQCNAGFPGEGTVMLSPGFPYAASVPCDFFLTVDEGKAVEVEIVFLEANPCCDFLVLHDLFLGGNQIANITGEVQNVTYTSTSNLMRVSWQPNGGVNVRGLAMTYRGV